MSGMKVLSPKEARVALRLAGEYHKGKVPLPPEIVAKKKEIGAATKNAHLFIVRTGAIDEGMVRDVVQLKLELDTLYSRWAQRETAGVL
jgi:hypothetical protein